jgi:amidophosphoribosyltransferase
MGNTELAGLPLPMGFIRNHYAGRTIIESELRVRDFGIAAISLSSVDTAQETIL